MNRCDQWPSALIPKQKEIISHDYAVLIGNQSNKSREIIAVISDQSLTELGLSGDFSIMILVSFFEKLHKNFSTSFVTQKYDNISLYSLHPFLSCFEKKNCPPGTCLFSSCGKDKAFFRERVQVYTSFLLPHQKQHISLSHTPNLKPINIYNDINIYIYIYVKQNF